MYVSFVNGAWMSRPASQSTMRTSEFYDPVGFSCLKYKVSKDPYIQKSRKPANNLVYVWSGRCVKEISVESLQGGYTYNLDDMVLNYIEIHGARSFCWKYCTPCMFLSSATLETWESIVFIDMSWGSERVYWQRTQGQRLIWDVWWFWEQFTEVRFGAVLERKCNLIFWKDLECPTSTRTYIAAFQQKFDWRIFAL